MPYLSRGCFYRARSVEAYDITGDRDAVRGTRLTGTSRITRACAALVADCAGLTVLETGFAAAWTATRWVGIAPRVACAFLVQIAGSATRDGAVE